MEIIKKISEKEQHTLETKTPVIAFLGDSVTQGCFELFEKPDRLLFTACDAKNAYHSRVKEILSYLYPGAPVNILNAGVSGDNATEALKRLERDVLSYKPDLTVVCFGLNDSCFGMDNLENYCNSLTDIFERLQAIDSEIIFMTPNMMNTTISAGISFSTGISPEFAKDIAESSLKVQNGGIFDKFLEAAKAICKEKGVVVCDCYAKWKVLSENGVNVTELLSNKINHPTREMHWLFAGMLVNTMFEN